MKKRGDKKKNERGQAAIEFIVVVVGVLFFVLFFLSLSLLLVVSDYIEYATFMAARTYKSMSTDVNNQETRAKRVFDTYVNRINGVAQNFSIQFLPGLGGTTDQQSEGIEASYDINLFYLPPVFAGANAPPSNIRLATRTRLGRDSTESECIQYFNDFSRRVGFGADSSGLATLMDDNGC